MAKKNEDAEQVGAVQPGYARKVVAKAVGYYAGAVQKPGDSFVIVDPAHFSEIWMRDPEDGEVGTSDRDRADAAAAHAGAVGPAGQTVVYQGKAMTRDDAVDAMIGPSDNGQPKASKRAPAPVEPKQVVSQGTIVEVEQDHVFGPEPTVDDNGRLAPDEVAVKASPATAERLAAARKAKADKAKG